MYGKVFKIAEDRSGPTPRLEVYASFGGLLMLLKGDPVALKELEVDKRVYFLARLLR